MENNNEFEEMHRQIDLLKGKLSDQQIVNENII